MATKRGGRTISLRGDAARAFMEMATGKPSKNEDDELARLATIVHMSVADGNLPEPCPSSKRPWPWQVPRLARSA